MYQRPLHLNAVASGETFVVMAYRRSFESDDIPTTDEFKLLVKVRE